MPHILQEEIKKPKESRFASGLEKFDSLYNLYDAVGRDAFLPTLCVMNGEKNSMGSVANYIQDATKKYRVANWFVRCESRNEKKSVSGKAFMHACSAPVFEEMMDYCEMRLNQGFNLVCVSIPKAKFYATCRFDFAYSFGAWFQDGRPKVEIYPAVDLVPVKKGRISPLYVAEMKDGVPAVEKCFEADDNPGIYKYRDSAVKHLSAASALELPKDYHKYNIYSDHVKLYLHLRQTKYLLFDTDRIESGIARTIGQVLEMAEAFGNNIGPARDRTVLHGSVASEPEDKIIVFDASTAARWQNYIDIKRGFSAESELRQCWQEIMEKYQRGR